MSHPRSKVIRLTDGVLSATTDLVLALLFYNIEFMTKPSVHRAGEAMYADLEALNSKTIKRALRHLKRRGLVQTAKEGIAQPRITEMGRKKVRGELPFYDHKRVWDGILYFVTYDVPTKQNYLRDLLRQFLRRIGCGPLQESVWITPYNPTALVREFVQEYAVGGTVLVSHMGKDGQVAGLELPELLEKVYELSSLNSRYASFLADYKKVDSSNRAEAIFTYLSILNEDPQLPFELLPEDWLGEKAYKHFKRLFRGKLA